MRDFEKELKSETSAPDTPPTKKRRIQSDDDSIDAKLNAIRSNMDQQDQQTTIDATETPKKNKKKNKNKNKTPEQQAVDSKKPDFDYSTVDFKEFGGGSIVEQNNEIKMKFHGKVRKMFLFNF